MLARRQLPEDFQKWNERHGAPFGRAPILKKLLQPRLSLAQSARILGPFSIQTNNTLRTFEYPWAYFASQVTPGMRVVEIGGGLSGFGFVLSKAGCHVVNVDPGMNAKGVGWPCTPESVSQINRALGTGVELRNTTVTTAKLEREQYDRAISISVLEHLPKSEIEEVVRAVYDALRPGGLFVITLDLFLDTAPFARKVRNKYGENIDASWLASLAPFHLTAGRRDELYGFPEFEAGEVMSRLSEYMIGSYPALAQCMVLSKPTRSQ
jgi:2-polyprenyl-3-methyl-5-hydroxy-6-metoxy-1,4-benzoquinol methylase